MSNTNSRPGTDPRASLARRFSALSRGHALSRGQQRTRLIIAAEEVFAAKGYHATTMDDIGKRANVSKAVLYQHFPGKFELFVDVLEYRVDPLVNQVTLAMESTIDNRQRVRNAVAAYLDLPAGAGQVLLQAFESDLRREPPVWSLVDRVRGVCVRAVKYLLEDAQMGETEAELLAASLAGAIHAGAQDWLASQAMSKVEAVELISTLVWKGIDRGFSTGTLQLVQHEAGEAVPVTIYLESAADANAVERAVLDLLYESGFVLEDARPPVIGSWFRSMRARPKDPAEVPELLARLERALELQTLHKPQAEVDAAQADGAAKVISALESTQNAVVRIGSLLLVKVDGVVVVRNLTQQELWLLQRNSGSLASPRAVLKALEEFVAENELGRRAEEAVSRPAPRV